MNNNDQSRLYSVRVVLNNSNISAVSSCDCKRVARNIQAHINKPSISRQAYPFNSAKASRRTGKNVIKTLHEVEQWDSFLTMYLPTPTKSELASCTTSIERDAIIGKRLIELKNCFARFCSKFTKSFTDGWLFYWFEVNKYGQVHVHACVKNGMPTAWFQNWAAKVWVQVCRGKIAPGTTGRSSKRPVKVTAYSSAQAGYATRKRKKCCRVQLANIAHEYRIKTFGFIGKENCRFVGVKKFTVTADEMLKLQQIIIENMHKKAIANGYEVNGIQIAHILGGDFWHGFMDAAEVVSVLAYLEHRRRKANHTSGADPQIRVAA